MTALAANVLVRIAHFKKNFLQSLTYFFVQAGGMILPTYVGHDEIWCGGEQVFFSPTKSVDGYGLTALTVVQYSIDQLTAHTSPCSLQGSPSSFFLI